MKSVKVKVIYSVFILVLYLVSGSLLIITSTIYQEGTDFRFVAFGVVVICYGLFRGYRAYWSFKHDEIESNENL